MKYGVVAAIGLLALVGCRSANQGRTITIVSCTGCQLTGEVTRITWHIQEGHGPGETHGADPGMFDDMWGTRMTAYQATTSTNALLLYTIRHRGEVIRMYENLDCGENADGVWEDWNFLFVEKDGQRTPVAMNWACDMWLLTCWADRPRDQWQERMRKMFEYNREEWEKLQPPHNKTGGR